MGEDSSDSAARADTAQLRPPPGADSLLERDAGLAAAEWLAEAAGVGAAAVFIEGEAGIGKTALWERGIELVSRRGHEVLAVRPRPADADLPFLGLSELLDPIADRSLPLLPAPLARALRVLLFREEQRHATERRTVFAAAARAISVAAAERSVVIAIDDLQWLDADSAAALAFAIPRLGAVRIGLLVARRTEESQSVAPLDLDRALPASRMRTIRPEPLTVRAVRQLLLAAADLAPALPQAARIHEVSAGNPFHALEIARLVAAGAVHPQPGEPLPLPPSVRSVVEQRLRGLAPTTRRPLIAAAVMARPTIAAVAAAAGAEPALWLDQAAGAGLLQVAQGRVAFTHPLFAAAVIDLALPEEVRGLHERIAGVVADPEERAVHLARACYPPDSRAAAALEDSARMAGQRGARLAAGERYHQSALFTPEEDLPGRVRRCLAAADAYRDAGNLDQAIRVAAEALPLAPSGPERARLLLAIASTEAVPDLNAVLAEALQHAGPDPALRARILTLAAESEWLDGDMAAVSEKFRAAAALAGAAGDAEAEVRAAGLAALAGTLLCAPDAADLLARAAALETPGQQVSPWYSPRHWLAVRALWHDDLAAAIGDLEAEYRRAEEEGNEFDQSSLTFHLTTAHCRAGDLVAAAGYADLGYELMSRFGSAQNLGVSCAARALALAHLGPADRARAVAAEGIAAASASRDVFFEVHLRSAITFLEVSLGEYAAAAEASARLPQLVAAMGIRDPGVFPFTPDRVEALAAIGRLDEAMALTTEWELLGAELGRPRLLATGARCRALCQAASGELAAAQESALAALRAHEQFAQPLELARTLLVRGRISRRLKQKSAARAVLMQARSIFAQLGAPLWVARADAELARVGGRPPAEETLTASERSVADAVASGATNREAADQLFLSVSTVEAMLSSIYRKLAVRSRTEMAATLRDQAGSLSA